MVTKVKSGVIGDNTVGITQLNVSDGSDGQFLRTNGAGTLSFATVSGTTINSNANNRVITGSGTANTLEGETNFVYDGTDVGIGLSSPNGDAKKALKTITAALAGKTVCTCRLSSGKREAAQKDVNICSRAPRPSLATEFHCIPDAKKNH